jgi:soluble lytic murein transglycosylase-like protein
MRIVTMTALSLVLLAGSARAQVRLVTRADGRKVITNIGSPANNRLQRDYKWLARQHDRRSAYDAIINSAAARHGVDPTLVRAVIQVESDFNPRCVSTKGARGLMQLIPETARRYGVRDVFDPADNINGGVKYLADLLRMFDNDFERALAGYNAGENAVIRHAGIPPYSETMTYVRRAMTVYTGRPYGDGGATGFAGGRGGRKLAGGFKTNVMAPLAAVLPGMRYLGSR